MDAATLSVAMGCTRAVADRYVADMNAAMLQAGCTTVNRAAMWCAQVGHESAGLKYMEEIASGAAYEGRKDLGNTQPGDGRRFKGRGPIQLTGRHNYGLFGQWCAARGLAAADTFTRDPAQVATSRWGFLAAAWYWTAARPKLNAQADAGDLTAATRSINGGTNGLADRRTRWDRCRALGPAVLPAGPGPTAAPAPAAPPPAPSRPPQGEAMYEKTPEPRADQGKWDWPTTRLTIPFEPGQGVLVKLDHAGRGGWVHLIRWWVRGARWSANVPVHDPRDHPVGASNGHAGSERFVGFGWVSPPPAGADFVEIVASAPDGMHLTTFYPAR